MSLFEARAKPGVKMSYRAVGSGKGQFEFIGKNNGFKSWNQDFGSGDIPIKEADYQTLTDQGVEFVHFPFQLGAMSFFYNMPEDAVPAEGLKFNACLLAKIFKREITTWDHDEIMELNPKLNVPADEPIKVFRRTYSSSTTGGITTYLHDACPAIWTSNLVGSSITWPIDTTAVEGSGGMSSAIASTQYSIGYIDSGHGHDKFLTEIELENKAGKFRSSIEAAEVAGVQNAAAKALEIGVLPSNPTADFSKVSFHNMDGEDVWPIVAVSYIYTRTDIQDLGERGCLLKAFLTFIISDEGQSLLPKYGFTGIPNEVKNVATDAIGRLQTSGCTEWKTETDYEDYGQFDYVISGKRRAFGEYDRGDIHSELSKAIDELKALLDQQSESVKETKGSPVDQQSKEEEESDLEPLGLAGLIVAVIALLVAIGALCKTGGASSPKASYGGIPQSADTEEVAT